MKRKLKACKYLYYYHGVLFFKTVTQNSIIIHKYFFEFILYTLHVSSQNKNAFKSACLVMAALQMFFVDKISCDKKHFPLAFMYGYYPARGSAPQNPILLLNRKTKPCSRPFKLLLSCL